jgi:hypothetical protein
MTTRIKNCISCLGLTFLVLFAALFWTTGCATHLDPLAGWKPDFDSRPGDQAIEKDYHDYIQKLPPEEKKYAGPIECFKDGTGQHAIVINIGINGTSWKHVLIYDKNDKRIKTVKYSSGNYRS